MVAEPATPTAEPYAGGDEAAAPWTRGLEEFAGAATYWAATRSVAGAPHVVPVLAVVVEGDPYFAAGPRTSKARNLARDPRLTVTTHGGSLDLVVEGTARRVTEPAALSAVADAYATKYGWEVTVRDGAFHAEGAPTAGPPPYHVYRVTPRRAFGFPTGDGVPPTRWTFPDAPV